MRLSWRARLGVLLVAASAVLYLVHYLIFRDVYQVAVYGLSDLAFLPLEVLLVVIIIEEIISNQEKQSKLNKLNMVIGAYFSEVGTALLKAFSTVDPHVDRIRSELIVKGTWTGRDFLEASARLKQYDYCIAFDPRNPAVLHFLENLRDFLVSKREFLLGLLENPNLLEYESFSEQLWAVFHLAEELAYRTDLAQLPDADYRHLATDSKRAYSALIVEWLKYMEHLRNRYPYLFSLALRTNPFDTTASPVIIDQG
jgi:hypothetical protein